MSTFAKQLEKFKNHEVNIIDIKDARHRCAIREVGADYLIAETSSVKMLYNTKQIVRVEEAR